MSESGPAIAAAIDSDSELQAIRSVLSALIPLKQEARLRVLDYVLGRLGMSQSGTQQTSTLSVNVPLQKAVDVSNSLSASPARPDDIRSLTKEKLPRSANEMAALVAYYVSELAPESHKKPTITADDIKLYFKQALFKLPQSSKMTLVNAKNSGYLESVGAGQYRLNPVGYNLVVHNLPSGSSSKKKPKVGKTKIKKTSRRAK